MSRRVLKGKDALPPKVRAIFAALEAELIQAGPIAREWPNFKKNKGTSDCFHCHIKKGNPTYVAVWRVIGTREIEVVYVGTHEGADYGRIC